MSLKGKTVFITGGSRGIGKAMALKLAAAGANIVIAAKSVEEDPRLGGTIFTAAAEIEALGVKALAVQVDIRDEAQIADSLESLVVGFLECFERAGRALRIEVDATEHLTFSKDTRQILGRLAQAIQPRRRNVRS